MTFTTPSKELIKQHREMIGEYNLMKAHITDVIEECKGIRISVNHILHIICSEAGGLTVQYYYTENNEDYKTFIFFPITWLYMSREELLEVIEKTGKRDKWQ